MGELFEEFKSDMLKSDLGDRMEIDFIDLMDDDVSGHEYMKPILEKGYKLPLTFINQVPAFAGALDVTKIQRAAKKFI